MITLYPPQHALHRGKLEMFRGQLVPCFEVPARADFVLQELVRRGVGPVRPPQESSTPRTSPLLQPTSARTSGLPHFHPRATLIFWRTRGMNGWRLTLPMPRDAFPYLWRRNFRSWADAVEFPILLRIAVCSDVENFYSLAGHFAPM